MTTDKDGDVFTHLVMAKTKADERAEGKIPKKKTPVSEYPFIFVEENHNKKSPTGNFQEKTQTAVSGTEHTVSTENGNKYRDRLKFRALRKKTGPCKSVTF